MTFKDNSLARKSFFENNGKMTQFCGIALFTTDFYWS